jgi:hypothetical protein
METRSVVVFVAALAGVAVCSTAARAGEESELAALHAEMQREEAALATRDCVEACRALGSMRRAAERICRIEPGPKCTDARARVQAATDRVSRSCPECAAAKEREEQQLEATRKAEPAATPAPQAAPAAASMPAEAAPRKGGCAGCAIGTREDRGLGLGIVALLFGAVLVRGRRRDSR